MNYTHPIATIAAIMLMLSACGPVSEEKLNALNHDHHDHVKVNEDLAKDPLHESHRALQNDFSHSDIAILNPRVKVDMETQKGIQEVIEVYLQIKNALVLSELTELENLIGIMQVKVEKVPLTELDDDSKSVWQQHASLYAKELNEMRHISGLEEKRSYFSHLSEVLYCTIKSFELQEEVELYSAFCPMAFENQGAYWITDSKLIENPYFGDKMLKCGNIKEEL